MVKYGFSSITEKRIYYTYVCEHCGKNLGRIEIIYDGNHSKEIDDIAGWRFCPYCGDPLWGEDSWWE